MNVGLVMDNFNAGGAERFVKDLAIHLKNHDLALNPIVIVANEQGELKDEFYNISVPIVSIDLKPTVKNIPKGVYKTHGVLVDNNIDIVHSHLAYPDLITRVSSRIISLPHLSTYHSVRQNRIFIKNLAERLTWKLSDKIICVSEGVLQSYNRRKNMDVIYNGVEIEEINDRTKECTVSRDELGIDKETTVLVNIGRCIRVKKQKTLINAMKILESENIVLFILGDGPLKSKLRQKCVDKDVDDKVIFPGYVENIVPYLSIGDIFVSSSSREGLPTAHLEAMAAELPIIATDIPGVREIVKHGENGFLYPIGDSETLSSHILNMGSDERKKLGKNGVEIARSKFTMEEIADKYVDIYSELVN